ncbi:MAG: hypothetical protein CMJ81_14135 [Planctomycetaceae bacterium]|nr:hypothetical protein [Planctomycetaceae bacterium]MBP61533.1 hypothetical protein [Planctomycetaceae bacterium]
MIPFVPLARCQQQRTATILWMEKPGRTGQHSPEWLSTGPKSGRAAKPPIQPRNPPLVHPLGEAGYFHEFGKFFALKASWQPR